jgi:molybdopterin-guanine dinucleotide biosynthesis protein A
MSREGAVSPVGLVLAGGESSRFGEPGKALAGLGGQFLLQHVLGRLEPQVSRVLLSVHETRESYVALGFEQVVDVVERQRGPLTGLVSGLLRLECKGYGQWLLMCPCDAPFLPPDLSEKLTRCASEQNVPVAVARYDGIVQPVFSLWRQDVLPAIKSLVLERGRGGLMSALDEVPHAVVDWPLEQPPPFFNVNTPEDLAEAEQWVDAPGSGK